MKCRKASNFNKLNNKICNFRYNLNIIGNKLNSNFTNPIPFIRHERNLLSCWPHTKSSHKNFKVQIVRNSIAVQRHSCGGYAK